MINNTLSIFANINAHNCIITPSTTINIEISMVNTITLSIIGNTGINRCRTAVTTITISVVVIITTITCLRLIPLLPSLPVLGCYYCCH